MAEKFRVARSVTGLGAFATCDIRKDEFIVEYTGPRIPDAQAEKLMTKYLFNLENGLTLDGSPKSNRGRWINHSCRPNAWADLNRGRVRIRARRAIRAGEEITFNYGKDYFETFITKKHCRCEKCKEARKHRR